MHSARLLFTIAAIALLLAACDRRDRDGYDVAPEGSPKPIITQPWPETTEHDMPVVEREGTSPGAADPAIDPELGPAPTSGAEDGSTAPAGASAPGAGAFAPLEIAGSPTQGRLALVADRGRVIVTVRAPDLPAGTYQVRILAQADCEAAGADDTYGRRQPATAEPIGDLGSIRIDQRGASTHPISTSEISLTGPNAVIGRAVALTDRRGALIACGRIQ